MRKWILSSLLILLVAALAACGGGKDESADKGEKAEGLLSDGKLTVGVTAGEHEEIMEQVKELAAKQDLEIDVKTFSDYPIVNEALSQGDLDLNVFQHKPYLEQQIEDRGYDIVPVGNTITTPMGVYSNTIKDIKDLKKGAKIGLPNDPTNGGRALLIFEKAGMIKLKEGVGNTPSVKDIEENKNNYEFVELEAAQIPRQLDDLEAAAINSNYAIEAGFVPTEDSIFIEDKDSPWVNVVASRAEDKDDEAIKKFLSVYQSDEIKKFIDEKYKGSVIAGW
ncbi:MetQ/NlpA family ABC transporter substrate-binding protein [Siminovitchia acidinfaciens]|uniref:Lipoprotein n=1 Tax=Siminovitchia acidinfaciens TaxID=2321395 RepID=A0A429XT51_9BACI|nr:MetQ/NlpA family ABC transporter substrate-binding protein [Siminovitchia acidinfaciens]RST70874.1 MetQ/NlpA family ABC transporter substrate-binding protein [Siminovitchia acidinfaciens]